MGSRSLFAAAILSCAAVAAHADTYQYTFNYNDDFASTTATFTVPALLTASTLAVPATGSGSLFGSPLTVTSVDVEPTAGTCNAADACFTANTTSPFGPVSFTLDFASDVDSVGTFTAIPDGEIGANGTVTIADLSTTSAPSSVTPEPSSLLLLGSGLLGAAAKIRRQRA